MTATDTPTADVCLLLEGTYPYVSGGVSTWVHQIISSLPEVRFAIFYIGGQKDGTAVMKYELPANVVCLEELYLFEVSPPGRRRAVPGSWSGFYAALRKLLLHLPDLRADDVDQFSPLLAHIASHREVTFDDFYHDQRTWAVLREVYERCSPDESFLHFFWTARYIVEPLWRLARALPHVPRARIYHTACTGYAGFLGAVSSEARQAPLILSEHGIYLKERIQDIWRSKWIPHFPSLRPALGEPLGSFQRMWIGFFDMLSRVCYDRASSVVSLFERNAAVQQHFGADASKISIVPNGIAVEACEALRQQRILRRQVNPTSRVVGFLGRIVPIKDVKTLIRAARRVCESMPDAQFLLAGPFDEDPEYAGECSQLVAQMRLEKQVHFLGMRQRDEVLPLMDVMVLTSVSEGLPFVVLEAMACGVPIVSTDVGACRELLEGQAGETPALGSCGLVAEVGDSDQIARQLLQLLDDASLQEAMSLAGQQRAYRSYHESRTLGSYWELYRRLTTPGTAPVAVETSKAA